MAGFQGKPIIAYRLRKCPVIGSCNPEAARVWSADLSFGLRAARDNSDYRGFTLRLPRLQGEMLEYFTVPLHSPNGRHFLSLGLCKGTVTGFLKTGGNSHWWPAGHVNP